jgi:ferredoxin
MGCRVCVSQCPQKAFALVRDLGKGEPLEIHKLICPCGSVAIGLLRLDVVFLEVDDISELTQASFAL